MSYLILPGLPSMLVSKIKNDIASLGNVYYIFNNPDEIVKNISDEKKKAIKMVKVLSEGICGNL